MADPDDKVKSPRTVRGPVLAAAATVAMLLAGCGGESGDEVAGAGVSTTSASPAVPASLPVEPVPWEDRRPTASDFEQYEITTTSMPAAKRSCTSKDVSAELPAWSRGDTDLPPAEAERRWIGELGGRLLGFVAITNRSATPCFLSGQPTVVIAANAGTASVTGAPSNIRPEAKRRRLTIPPGRQTSLRLHWGGPYCGEPHTDQVVRIELAEGDRAIDANVRQPATPPCLRGEAVEEGGPNGPLLVGTYEGLTTSESELRSPRSGLELVLDAPAQVRRGELLTYAVHLRNPTSEVIDVAPCPVYTQVLAVGDRGYSSGEWVLACDAVPALPPGGDVSFEMRLAVTDETPTGDVRLRWLLRYGDGIGRDKVVEARITVVP